MEEIVEGVFHWTAVHPNTGSEAGCHLVSASRTAIDPLLPDEGIEWFEGRGVERIVLSARHHLRHAREIAERFDCPILCHESGLYEFENGLSVEGFVFGDRLADDVVALEMDAISPDDTVLRIEANGTALLFADGVVNRNSLGFVSDGLIGDDPEAVKAKIRQRCAALLDEDFEHLLFAHGDPWIGDGHPALQAFASGLPAA
jgi:glyoxylase-like metal-dependent hydrolase (beta-lactamase superfamily II)